MSIFLDDAQEISQMTWLIVNRVLQISISGVYTPAMAAYINTNLMAVLDKTEQSLTLVLDCSDMQRPVNFETIREEQVFMHHPMLTHIYVAAKDRLARFSMMVIFNSSSANFRVFDSIGQVQILVNALNVKRP